MKSWLRASKPYLIGGTCFLLGAAVSAVGLATYVSNVSTDAHVNDVGEYAGLLDLVELPPDPDDGLVAFVWDFAQNYAGLAGTNFVHMSPRARADLVRVVMRIDRLAPQFEAFAQASRWGVYSAEDAATMRACILSAPNEDAAEVQSCVRALQPALFPESRTKRELAAR